MKIQENLWKSGECVGPHWKLISSSPHGAKHQYVLAGYWQDSICSENCCFSFGLGRHVALVRQRRLRILHPETTQASHICALQRNRSLRKEHIKVNFLEQSSYPRKKQAKVNSSVQAWNYLMVSSDLLPQICFFESTLENQWKSMNIYENLWKCTKINENPWKSMKIDDHRWKSI